MHRTEITRRIVGLLPLLTVIVVTLLLFLPICGYQFSIIDDDTNIFNNPYLNQPGSQNIAHFWTHTYYELYMPLTYTLWAWCARIAPLATPQPVPPGGTATTLLNVAVFHTASLLLHIAVAALVFAILRRLRFRPWPSAAGALLFAIHPMQIQAVAWITGMNNLTGGFFGFLALYVYLLQVPEWDDSTAPNAERVRRRSTVCLPLATALFIAALLSKPTTVVIPLFVAIIEPAALRRPIRRWIGPVVLWILLAIPCALLNHFASAHESAAVWSPLWARPFVAGDALAFYMVKLVLPAALTFDYYRTPQVLLLHRWGYFTCLLPICLIAYLWHRTSSTSAHGGRGEVPTGVWLRVAALIFVAGLLPTLGLVPYYTQTLSTVSDRFLYLSLLGPAIAATALLNNVSGSGRKNAVVFSVTLLVLLAIGTRLQLPVWHDMVSQTQNVLDIHPNSGIGHEKRGLILRGQGDLVGALHEFDLEVTMQGGQDAAADFYFGGTLAQVGRFAEAVRPLEVAFAATPESDDYADQLTTVLLQVGRTDEAESVLRKHLLLNPQDARAQASLDKITRAR